MKLLIVAMCLTIVGCVQPQKNYEALGQVLCAPLGGLDKVTYWNYSSNSKMGYEDEMTFLCKDGSKLTRRVHSKE